MITIKIMLRVLVFSLVFTMLATHQAWGKNKENCEKDKNFIKRQCENCIAVSRKARTNKLCCNAMKRADMACVCHSITLERAAQNKRRKSCGCCKGVWQPGATWK